MSTSGVEAGALATLGLHRGRVESFNEEVGLGVVCGPVGPGVRYDFHCTQITDGTRRIAVGTEVAFSVVAGRRGAWEAAALTPLRCASAPSLGD